MRFYSDRQRLELFISEGEHQQQDFKFEISSAKKIAKSIAAFSNTDGGRLLIGVKDNGKIAGIKSEEELYMIEAAAHSFCHPAVDIEFTEYSIEGKQILIATIPKASNKPILARDDEGKELAYIRIKDENILASAVHIQLWKEESCKKDELVTLSDQEQKIFDILDNYGAMTINQLQKRTRINRVVLIKLVAKFISYELIEPIFDKRRFIYKLILE